MIKVKRFVNELMASNCFIIYDERYGDCLVVDPASRDSLNEISFFEKHNIKPSHILLTHEHTDHTWGVNAIVAKYDSKIVCSKACADNLNRESRAYFLLYYDDKSYKYSVARVDVMLEDIEYKLVWHNIPILFISTPGHSMGSVCIQIEDKLFTGDTLMQFKPFINKRNGSKEAYENSLVKLKQLTVGKNFTIFPGHGETFKL